LSMLGFVPSRSWSRHFLELPLEVEYIGAKGRSLAMILEIRKREEQVVWNFPPELPGHRECVGPIIDLAIGFQ
jgi:hypothetical protein